MALFSLKLTMNRGQKLMTIFRSVGLELNSFCETKIERFLVCFKWLTEISRKSFVENWKL